MVIVVILLVIVGALCIAGSIFEMLDGNGGFIGVLFGLALLVGGLNIPF